MRDGLRLGSRAITVAAASSDFCSTQIILFPRGREWQLSKVSVTEVCSREWQVP